MAELLPVAVVASQLERILKLKGAKWSPDAEAWIEEVRKACYGWTPEELVAAVGTAMVAHPKFPLLHEIVSARPPRVRTEHQATETRQHCLSCGVHYFYAGFELPNGEVHGRNRCLCRDDSTRWHTAKARAWVVPEVLVADGWGMPRGWAGYRRDAPPSPEDRF